jgi:predicted dehydrogenase
MKRRDFLAAAAAPLVPAPARIRIAFLGASHAHGMEKVRVMGTLPEFELVGVAETNPDVRSALQARGVPLLTRRAVLGDASITAIAVESQVADHAADGRAALEAGKHLHLEKSPAADLEGLRTVLDLAARKRLLVQTGYMWRHNPGINAVLEIARQGWLGEIFRIRAVMNTRAVAGERSLWSAYRGGIFFELAGHFVDPIARLMGRPDRVTPYLQRHGDDALADSTLAVMEWPRALATVSSARVETGRVIPRVFEVVGKSGSATLTPIEPPVLNLTLASAAGPYKSGAQTVTFPRYERYIDDFRELAGAIRGERKLCVTPQEELLAHETLLRACGMTA